MTTAEAGQQHRRMRMARCSLSPLNVVAGDSLNLAAVVLLRSGRRIRPSLWIWQDMATRRILAWQVGRAGNRNLAKESFADLCTDHGIPDMAMLDNGPAAGVSGAALGELGVEMRGDVRSDRLRPIERALAVLSQELGIGDVWRSWHEARRAVAAAMAAHNARPLPSGQSPDDRWATEIDRTPVRIPTPAQAAILGRMGASW